MLAAEGTYQSRPPCVGRPHKQVVCALDMSAISTEAERGPKWPPCYRQGEPHDVRRIPGKGVVGGQHAEFLKLCNVGAEMESELWLLARAASVTSVRAIS